MVAKFTACRYWQIFPSTGKELANFFLFHGAVFEQNFVFWILPVIWLLLVSCIQILSRKTLNISCHLFRMLWDGKIFGVHFHCHDSPYSLFLGCPFQVFFTFCFVYYQSNVTKFNFPCFVSCSVSEVKS